jgi:hypothetical protein
MTYCEIVQPTVTQCMQIVTPSPTVNVPDTINVLVGGVQTVTYYSEPHFNGAIIITAIVLFAIGIFISWIFFE